VDQNHDAVFHEIVLGCGFLIENLIDILDLEEMISRPERPKLRFPTLFGAGADGIRIGTGNAASFFRAIEIGFGSHAMFNGPLGTFLKNLVEIVVGNIQPARLAGSRRNVAKELMHQIAKLDLDLLQRQIAVQQANAAIDIKTNTAGRDHAILPVNSGYASNWEAVTLMDIGHCKGAPNNAGKHGDVRCLF